VVDILSGDRNPSGRLPASFPHVTGQVPVHYSQHATGRPQTPPESRYLDAPAGALYPFGFGLSYSTVTCENLRIEETAPGARTIRASAQNAGERDIDAVIQLYVRDLVGSRARPVRELKRFQKVSIAAGASAEISWQIGKDDLAFSRADGTWGAEPGEFRVWVGTHSRDGVEGMMTLEA
ncbi:MAG TPA: fibronectin type III-like domain-contianing protein, partial [Luteolibacter sp.]|nr:fibronectin type III-like domain-contianing protein [Luteolibacter sp.]